MANQKEPFQRKALDEEIERLSQIQKPKPLMEMPEARLTDDLRHAHRAEAKADMQSLSNVYTRLRVHEYRGHEPSDTPEVVFHASFTHSSPELSTHAPRSISRRTWLQSLAAVLVVGALVSGFLLVFAYHPNTTGTSVTPMATVTITPRSQIVQNNYLISGVTTAPDSTQHQVAARVLTAQSQTQQATGLATGSIGGRRASGMLQFTNNTANTITLASTIITGRDGVQVTFNGSVVLPANTSSVNVNAYAVDPGAAGNIPALDISGACCASGILVKNPTAFTNGQDAASNNVIQQSDIDGAAQPLIVQLMKSTQVALQTQIKSHERVADHSLQCQSTVSANQKPGDIAKSVTVSVSVACTEEVFNIATAQQMAGSLLLHGLPKSVDLTNYVLVPPIVINLLSAAVVSTQGQVSISMQAAGRWVYQFNSQQQQQIKQALFNQSIAHAQNILAQYAGVASASIRLSRGSTLPPNARDITLKIVPIPGLQPGS